MFEFFLLVCVEFRGYKGIWERVEGVKESSGVRNFPSQKKKKVMKKKKLGEMVKLCKLK